MSCQLPENPGILPANPLGKLWSGVRQPQRQLHPGNDTFPVGLVQIVLPGDIQAVLDGVHAVFPDAGNLPVNLLPGGDGNQLVIIVAPVKGSPEVQGLAVEKQAAALSFHGAKAHGGVQGNFLIVAGQLSQHRIHCRAFRAPEPGIFHLPLQPEDGLLRAEGLLEGLDLPSVPLQKGHRQHHLPGRLFQKSCLKPEGAVGVAVGKVVFAEYVFAFQQLHAAPDAAEGVEHIGDEAAEHLPQGEGV